MSYAVSLYLVFHEYLIIFQVQNYERSLEVLESYEKTLKENKEKLKPHERSEVTIFKARIYEDMGDF